MEQKQLPMGVLKINCSKMYNEFFFSIVPGVNIFSIVAVFLKTDDLQNNQK